LKKSNITSIFYFSKYIEPAPESEKYAILKLLKNMNELKDRIKIHE